MRTATLIPIFLSLLTLATAAPVPATLEARNDGSCLCQSTAQQTVDAFFSITSGGPSFNATIADAITADSFSDTSGGVASIINSGAAGPVPLLGPTFSSKQDFITSNAQQPATKFTQLNLYYTCNVAVVRFRVELQPQPVLGISILEVVKAPKSNTLFEWQIKQVYGEVNSAAWLVDLGVFTPKSTS